MSELMAGILALGVIGTLFCYAEMRYHEGVYDGLTMAEKMHRDSFKESKRV